MPVQFGVQRAAGLRVDRVQSARDGSRRGVASVVAEADVVAARTKILDLRDAFRA